jgi:hypothetical protein
MEAIALLLFACDPLIKVFSDALAPDAPSGPIVVWSARNEVESAQFAIRATAALPGTTVRVGALTHEDGTVLPAGSVAWHYVGTIPLTKNTPCERPGFLSRSAPCDMPDVLLPDRSRDLPANTTQPVWLTFRVPAEAPAGIYRGEVTVTSGALSSTLALELHVWPFALPDERHLLVTNWIDYGRIAQAHNVKLWSEEFWSVYARYLENLHDHRQNIAWVPWSLIRATREADGRLSFDYALFDRYVETIDRHGTAAMIELQFLGSFKDGWGGREIALNGITATDRQSGQAVQLDFAHGTALLLADLQQHLEQRGWLERAVIHVADEPSQNNVLSWREQSRRVHQAAPRLRRIDAIEASDFGDDLEVWVPKLSHLRNWYPQYKAAQARGQQLWFYICCHPTGGFYPNRFLDYPLSAVRVLHWLNYAYGLDGYLHWGWCAWPADNPFGPPPENLPPGDCNAVYPGPDGPLNSLRWETQRDSLEDFEYLWLLTERTKAVQARLGAAAVEFDPAERGQELCRGLVRDFADVESDPATIHATRRVVAEEIVALDQEPLALLSTRPTEGVELVPGPVTVEVHGAVEPGTAIRGAEVHLEPSGRFRGIAFLSAAHPRITLTFSRDGKEKTLIRSFRVRTAQQRQTPGQE